MMAGECYRRQPAWMKDVVVGSVLKARSGALRVVRSVSRSKRGALHGVVFTIMRCSWTTSCYTILNYTDLIQRGFTLVKVKPRPLRSRLDREIRRCIYKPGGNFYRRGGKRYRRKNVLSCCDVEGVP